MLLNDDSTDQRLAQLLCWLSPTIVGFAIAYAAMGGIFQDWRTVASACSVGAHGLLTVLAQLQLRRGYRYRATYLVGGGAVASILSVTALQPALYPSMVVVPFLIAALLLQYAPPRHIWYCLAGCCAASILVVFLGEVAPGITRLPASIVDLLRLSSLMAIIVFALVMLGQFSSRLQDMLTRLRAAYARLEAQHAELARLSYQHELILNSAGEGIYGVNAQGIVTFVNPTAASMFGWDVSELVGQFMHTCTHGTQADGAPCPLLTCPMCAVLEDGVVRHQTDEVFWRKDGTSFPVEYVSAPIREHVAIGGAVLLFRDITERKQAEQALRRSERLYRTLASNLPNGAVFLFDHDLRFRIADGQALTALGFTRTALEGKTLWEALPPEMCSVLEPLYRAALAGEECVQESIYGDRTYVSYYLPVRNEQGEVFAGMIMSHDITDRKRAEQALIEERALLARRVEERTAELSAANAELARAARLKDEFLASMSHELRTPLNAILGLSETLQEQIYGALTSEQHQALQGVEESGRHLLTLINDILDLAKIGAGKLELELGPVAVLSLCQASLRFVQHLAQKKQITIETTIDPSVTALTADMRRLKQMLVNLLSNAVKFTPAGGRIGLEVIGDLEQQAVHLVVWDTGIGIAKADMPRLFQPFVQLDSRLARQYNGTGLGLALVYRFAELHGGSITVTSEPGAGSRFAVSLPWRAPDRLVASAGGALVHELLPSDHAAVPSEDSPGVTARPSGLTCPTILLVEDNEANITALSDYLNAKGYHVVVARSGAEAITHAPEVRPALILMDIQMPDVDGLEATQQIRADARVSNVPIIALTALAMPGDRARCLGAGVNEYISKPVRLRELVATIEQYLHVTETN